MSEECSKHWEVASSSLAPGGQPWPKQKSQDGDLVMTGRGIPKQSQLSGGLGHRGGSFRRGNRGVREAHEGHGGSDQEDHEGRVLLCAHLAEVSLHGAAQAEHMA